MAVNNELVMLWKEAVITKNIRTEYFKHAANSPFFFSSKCRLFHNATFFGSCVIHILYTACAKIKKKNSSAKGLFLNDAAHLCTCPCTCT